MTIDSSLKDADHKMERRRQPPEGGPVGHPHRPRVGLPC